MRAPSTSRSIAWVRSPILNLTTGKPKWEFAAGALFGISEATSDVTFKFDAEVKF